MQKRRIVTGIDIGTHTVRVVQAEWTKGEPLPHIIGTGTSESHGLHHGYIVNGTETTKSINMACAEAESISGVKIKRAFISAGGIGLEGTTTINSTMITRADGEVTDLDVAETSNLRDGMSHELQNRRVIHIAPIGYRIDGKEVLGKPQGMRGAKLEAKILLVTALSQHINDTIIAVEDAGIEVDGIFAAPLAAAYVTATRQQKTAGCVLANIGAETLSVVVFENNNPISLKVFPIGSTNITNDIALGLRISLDEAENVKLGETPIDARIPKKKLDEIINARLAEIFEIIESHLKKIGRNELLPAGIIITGGGSNMNLISEFAKNSLKIPSRIGYPAYGTSMGAPHEIADVPQNEIRSIPSWTVAYGLCILGFSSDKDEKNEWSGVKNLRGKITNFFSQFLP